ncbi:MAG: hypothetical protein N3B21_14910 [Clostridia bacterium]|nr:hypothetical protein [Clostridia bacterium]
MKFMFFKVKNKSQNGRKGIMLGIERILFFSFVVAFFAMIAVQTLLTLPSAKPIFSVKSDVEGAPLGIEEYLYKEGEIGLELLNSEGDENIKVLVNGDEVATFANKLVELTVRDGDVVEIDGSSSQDNASVEVVSKSENIGIDCIGKKVQVEANIKKLFNIKIK